MHTDFSLTNLITTRNICPVQHYIVRQCKVYICSQTDAAIKIVQDPTKKEDYTEQMEKIEAMMKRIQGLNDRLKKYQ